MPDRVSDHREPPQPGHDAHETHSVVGAVGLRGPRPPLGVADTLALQRLAGNRAVADLIGSLRGGVLARQVAATQGPGGPDPCGPLLDAIIQLLTEVAGRYNAALDDPHNLYVNHRTLRDAHPEYGSWDGHRMRFYSDREELRHRVAEWEADDRCRGHPLTDEQRQDLRDAQQWKDREYPARPAPSMRSAEPAPTRSVRVPPGTGWVAGGAVVGGVIGGVLGAVLGGAGGTAVEPGGGTLVVGAAGAAEGASLGARAGAVAGGALGAAYYWLTH